MNKCFDEGIIQSFLDGELPHELAENVTRHISICDDCAVAVANAEEELEFAYSALDREFDSLVPTQRLWSKINGSIEEQARKQSIWHSLTAFLMSPSAIGFASLVIVFGLFIGLYGVRSGSNVQRAAVSNVNQPEQSRTLVKTAEPESVSLRESAANENEVIETQPPAEEKFTARRTVYVEPETARRPVPQRIKSKEADTAYYSETLVSEDTYLKTIATLESSVGNQKDVMMNSSARFSFEKDLAVADETIKKLRDEVRSNPQNEAARVLLKTSYQNKIDLLNSLAEKSELMASLN